LKKLKKMVREDTEDFNLAMDHVRGQRVNEGYIFSDAMVRLDG
jgi:hypothetical protein